MLKMILKGYYACNLFADLLPPNHRVGPTLVKASDLPTVDSSAEKAEQDSQKNEGPQLAGVGPPAPPDPARRLLDRTRPQQQPYVVPNREDADWEPTTEFADTQDSWDGEAPSQRAQRLGLIADELLGGEGLGFALGDLGRGEEENPGVRALKRLHKMNGKGRKSDSRPVVRSEERRQQNFPEGGVTFGQKKGDDGISSDGSLLTYPAGMGDDLSGEDASEDFRKGKSLANGKTVQDAVNLLAEASFAPFKTRDEANALPELPEPSSVRPVYEQPRRAVFPRARAPAELVRHHHFSFRQSRHDYGNAIAPQDVQLRAPAGPRPGVRRPTISTRAAQNKEEDLERSTSKDSPSEDGQEFQSAEVREAAAIALGLKQVQTRRWEGRFVQAKNGLFGEMLEEVGGLPQWKAQLAEKIYLKLALPHQTEWSDSLGELHALRYNTWYSNQYSIGLIKRIGRLLSSPFRFLKGGSEAPEAKGECPSRTTPPRTGVILPSVVGGTSKNKRDSKDGASQKRDGDSSRRSQKKDHFPRGVQNSHQRRVRDPIDTESDDKHSVSAQISDSDYSEIQNEYKQIADESMNESFFTIATLTRRNQQQSGLMSQLEGAEEEGYDSTGSDSYESEAEQAAIEAAKESEPDPEVLRFPLERSYGLHFAPSSFFPPTVLDRADFKNLLKRTSWQRNVAIGNLEHQAQRQAVLCSGKAIGSAQPFLMFSTGWLSPDRRDYFYFGRRIDKDLVDKYQLHTLEFVTQQTKEALVAEVQYRDFYEMINRRALSGGKPPATYALKPSDRLRRPIYVYCRSSLTTQSLLNQVKEYERATKHAPDVETVMKFHVKSMAWLRFGGFEQSEKEDRSAGIRMPNELCKTYSRMVVESVHGLISEADAKGRRKMDPRKEHVDSKKSSKDSSRKEEVQEDRPRLLGEQILNVRPGKKQEEAVHTTNKEALKVKKAEQRRQPADKNPKSEEERYEQALNFPLAWRFFRLYDFPLTLDEIDRLNHCDFEYTASFVECWRVNKRIMVKGPGAS